MSEQRVMPEVLPGDLITRPGLYEARCGDIVRITGWRDGWWVSIWNGVRTYYSSDGRQRYDEGQEPNQWQLLHWVGPLPASEPEPATTTEQLAEIEGQAEPVKVREGRWKTRAGEIVSVSAMPTDDDNFSDAYPWWDGDVLTWANDGVFFSGYTAGKDLVEYLGPIDQPEPVPQPQPEPEKLPEGYRNDGGWSSVNGIEPEPWPEPQPEPQPQPQPEPVPESDAELRVRLLKEANDNQAETIGRLKGEARDLNMEIGGLERRLSERDARIRDLETMHAAAAQAVVDAGKANDKLRNLANNLRQQFEAAANEISEQRSYLDKYDKQLDQKDAQIRDLRIELEAAQQVQQPVSDEEREQIWNEATEQAGRHVVRWLRPLTLALHRQPDERFSRFMALTLSVLPDVLPELLGYAVEDEAEGEE